MRRVSHHASHLAAGAALLALAVALPLAAQPAPQPPMPPMRPMAPTLMLSAGPCDGTAPTRGAAGGSAQGEARREHVMLREYTREMVEMDGAEAVRRPEVPMTRPAGWLGVSTVDVSDLRWTRDGRIVRYCAYPVVVSVEPGSPADQGGLAAGDTIVAYAGRDLLRSGEMALDRLLVPGATVRVTVRRDGRTLVRPVVVGQRPTTAFFRSVPLEREVRVMRIPSGGTVIATTIRGGGGSGSGGGEPPTGMTRMRVSRGATPVAAPGAPSAPMAPGALFATEAPLAPSPALPPVPFTIGFGGASVIVGAQVVAMDDDLREAMHGDESGVLVIRVLPGTPAAAAGLRAGDVITKAGGTAVVTPSALHRAVLRGTETRTVALKIERRGKGKELTLRW